MKDVKLDRRTLLKLAALFAGYAAVTPGVAMDKSPRIETSNTDTRGNETATGSNDAQNGYAIGGTSNFKAVFDDPQMKAAFLLFLANVYHLFPEDRFHRLIEQVSQAAGSDKEIYAQVQARLPEIKPILADVRYALPALWKQKGEMTAQTLDLLGPRRKIDGYMEIGTTGRYASRLKSEVELTGDLVLLHSDQPTYSPIDIAERGGIGKLGRFVNMKDYAAISSSDIADKSLDLVTNFIGFHHSPTAMLDPFVRSLQRVLRPGGRMIVRDHDVNSPRMNRMVALAHDVFNMGLGTDWSANQREIRNFTSLGQLASYLGDRGFKTEGKMKFQPGDPTQNALMVFARV